MYNLTLVIPAKQEKDSLPSVIKELEEYKCKILVVLEPNDVETIKSIKNLDCKLVYQVSTGYGDAIKLGISNVKTELFCIFNADGSFNPKELSIMHKMIEQNKYDLIFASRYEKDCGSDDDTYVTWFGNKIFTFIGRFFFKLNITDILYTYVMGKKQMVEDLKLKYSDFRLCVELPIKAKKAGLKLSTSKSYERSRIGGKKKVNALKDGIYILIGMIKLFFFK